MPRRKEIRLSNTTTFLLIGLGRLLSDRLDAALAEEDLTLRHIGALGHLRTNPGMSVSDLAKRVRVTPQSMHATVRQLMARGAIATRTKGQGRRASLSITAEGERLLHVAAHAAAAIDAECLAGQDDLRATAREVLSQLFQK